MITNTLKESQSLEGQALVETHAYLFIKEVKFFLSNDLKNNDILSK